MYELLFEGRVQARGSQEQMRSDRIKIARFTGRDIAQYKIVKVA